MTLHQYLDTLKNKTVAVVGIGVSNTPWLRRLLQEGIRVTACDKRSRDALGALAEELEKAGCRLQLGENYLQGLNQDVIFRTPGLRPDVPELLAAKARGSEITSEMEVFFEVCPCTLLAVTGSDGKTTTTTIIAELLKAAGKTVILATSKPEAFARRIMEHFDLAQYCDFICGATLDETRTDKAEVIAYALETAGITDKTGLVMVGDREHDVLGAKKNGLPCIGAVYGYGTAEELTAAGAAALADTVDELHKLLLG